MDAQPEQLSFPEVLSDIQDTQHEFALLKESAFGSIPKDDLTHVELYQTLLNKELLLLSKSHKSLGIERLNKLGLAILKLEQARTEVVKRERLSEGEDPSVASSPSRVEVVIIHSEKKSGE